MIRIHDGPCLFFDGTIGMIDCGFLYRLLDGWILRRIVTCCLNGPSGGSDPFPIGILCRDRGRGRGGTVISCTMGRLVILGLVVVRTMIICFFFSLLYYWWW